LLSDFFENGGQQLLLLKSPESSFTPNELLKEFVLSDGSNNTIINSKKKSGIQILCANY
jgi:hypothetical protein